MRYAALLIILLATSCQHHRVDEVCRHAVLSQYAAAVEQWGPNNVEIWRLTSDSKTYTYHAQVKVRPGGPGTAWAWLPNYKRITYTSAYPQGSCRPIKKLK